jgi:hypothetical protein
MKNTLARKVPIPKGARRKVYYDTKELVQDQSVINFFPPNATRDASRDNYINNPFPGESARRVVGLSFELIKQFIRDDAANNIDSEAIINGIKDAGVILTADNDYKEFVRTPLEEHFNFEGSRLNIDLSIAGDPAAEGTTTTENKTAILQSADMYRLPDPFDVAPNQSVDLRVEFADASVFPQSTDWDAAGQGHLFMRAKMYVAEIEV